MHKNTRGGDNSQVQTEVVVDGKYINNEMPAGLCVHNFRTGSTKIQLISTMSTITYNHYKEHHKV